MQEFNLLCPPHVVTCTRPSRTFRRTTLKSWMWAGDKANAHQYLLSDFYSAVYDNVMILLRGYDYIVCIYELTSLRKVSMASSEQFFISFMTIT